MTAHARVLGLEEAGEWRALLAQVPSGAEPFFQPVFYDATQCAMGGTAECFVYEETGETVVYPYLRRRLNALRFLSPNSPLCDITGGYGYNGALATSEDQQLLGRFREAFRAHCEESHVVTEFVRFHPLLGNARLFAADCAISVQNRNVALDLRRPLAAIRSEYAHSCRKNLKKAEREHVRTFVEEGLGSGFEEFLRLYEQTMTRVGASEEYAFDRAYFERLCTGLVPRPLMVYAEWRGRIVSCEMALRSDRIVYSYLGGTDADAFAVRPNNLLKDALIGWAHAAGCEWYLLGGGAQPGDGIFRYKRTFAPDGVIDFQVGRRVYSPSAYEEVVSRWQAAAAPQEALSTRLQCYWD